MDDILKELVKTVVLIPNSNKRIGVILHDFNAAKTMAHTFYDMMEKVPEYLFPSDIIICKSSSLFEWGSHNRIIFFSDPEHMRGRNFDVVYISEMSKSLNPEEYQHINFMMTLSQRKIVCFE
jgi:hypothetical protein